jgi:carbon monoxide dehydrogenase subunit G
LEQSGEYEIAASRAKVWASLNDPEVLGSCIPGCQTIERDGDDAFVAKIKAKIGPVSATFQAEIALTDLDPPTSYTIGGAAKGGAAGFGKGSAEVTLTEIDVGTRLNYAMKASVGGKLAQIGSRLVDGAARKMADDFFGAFCAQVGQPDSHSPSDLEMAEPALQPEILDSSKKLRFEAAGNGYIWLIAFGALAVAMILVL